MRRNARYRDAELARFEFEEESPPFPFPPPPPPPPPGVAVGGPCGGRPDAENGGSPVNDDMTKGSKDQLREKERATQER